MAAMIGLLHGETRRDVVDDISRAARAVGATFHVNDAVEEGEVGLRVSFTGNHGDNAGRSYEEAMDLLNIMHSANDAPSVESIDRQILDSLFQAESKAHDKPVSVIHLHEVGRTGSLLNMYGIGKACAALQDSGAGEFVSSTIVTGRGIVVIAHGAVRVPAPACKHLLEGLKHEAGHEQGERATPTGIAAVKVLTSSQTDEIPTRFKARSIGFGTRRFAGRLGRTVLIWP